MFPVVVLFGILSYLAQNGNFFIMLKLNFNIIKHLFYLFIQYLVQYRVQLM